ncbi:hypothetical protein, partial [Shewanella atlantica]|uniref:hypothetical protein n=1 Tax=Shewanella atlantica TaxID=271099 RepID=UPI003734C185
FEPSMGFKAHTPLAGERLRPLGHLSVSWRTYYCLKKISQTISFKAFLFGAFLNRLTNYYTEPIKYLISQREQSDSIRQR